MISSRAVFADAGDPRFRDIVAALAGSDAAARDAAAERAAAYAPEAIGAIAPLLDSTQFETAQAARFAIERIAGGASSNPDTRAAASRALCTALDGTHKREWLLNVLSYTGDAEAVDPLIALFGKAPEAFDANLFALTRVVSGLPGAPTMPPRRGFRPIRWLWRTITFSAFENKPEPTPRALATRKVLARLIAEKDTKRRVALIGALGEIGDAEATPALLKLVFTDTGDAALAALGRIGDYNAFQAVRDAYARSQSPTALTNYLRATENQQPTVAARAYATLLESRDPRAQAAAIVGLGDAATSTHFVERVTPFLVSEHAAVRGAAKEALLAFEGPGFDEAIVRMYHHAKGAEKRGLLEVLAKRNPAVGRPAAESLLNDPDAELRDTAMRVLGKHP